jgi:hypothetical protein
MWSVLHSIPSEIHITIELALLRTSHLHNLSKLSENVFNVKVPFLVDED